MPLFYSGNLCSITKFFNIELILADGNFLDEAKDKLKDIFNLYEEKKSVIGKENETINSPLHPSSFYLSQEKLNDIYNSSFFKEFCDLPRSEKKSEYQVKCKENLEFHNINITNEEIIKRFKKIINDTIGKKKIIITYSH